METDLGAHLDIGLGAALPAYLARCAQDAVRSLRDVDRYQRLLLADEPAQASVAMMPKLLTARETANRLGVSTETALRWVRRGELPAFRLPGGAIRVDEAALETWLESRATPRPGDATIPRTPPTRPDIAHGVA